MKRYRNVIQNMIHEYIYHFLNLWHAAHIIIGLTHLILETKNLRACREDYALECLVLHAAGFLFNCVSPK
jgi:hypothetical protein